MAEKGKVAPKKRCFVIGPIGDATSDDRMHADWLLEGIIVPVFNEHFPDFKVDRADKISVSGSINEQIISALLTAELVIADLTTLNANAFYELGIRHTVQMPFIHMHLKGQRIPFDIAPFRSIEFDRRWPRDLDAARVQLKEFVDAAISEEHVVDNPVTFARGKVEFDKTASPADKVLSDEVADIKNKLRMMENWLVHRYPNNSLGGMPYVSTPRIQPDSLRIELRVHDPKLAETLNDFVHLTASGILGDLTRISGDDTWYQFEVPSAMVNRQILRTLRREAEIKGIKMSLVNEDKYR